MCTSSSLSYGRSLSSWGCHCPIKGGPVGSWTISGGRTHGRRGWYASYSQVILCYWRKFIKASIQSALKKIISVTHKPWLNNTLVTTYRCYFLIQTLMFKGVRILWLNFESNNGKVLHCVKPSKMTPVTFHTYLDLNLISRRAKILFMIKIIGDIFILSYVIAEVVL